MSARRVPDAAELRAALAGVELWLSGGPEPARAAVAAAVRGSARFLAAAHPGGSVEVRVPPYVVVQCIEGPQHRRGTPPNVVETDPRTWLRLVTGSLGWTDAVLAAVVSTSGSRSDLSDVLPITLGQDA